MLTPTAERRLLALILILFVALGFTYALVTPAFEASDELWHYPMVRHLADGNPLPVQVFDPALAGPWNQEASQPPLYYYLGAALTFWIDQSDMATARRLNPHVDNGVITPDGNTNLAVHDPAADPWAGALLAVRLVRLVSVLLSSVTVYLTYRLAAETAPGRPAVALGAAAINAFLPMFLFISGAVNNDNLAVPLASVALLLMVRIVTRRRATWFPVRRHEWAALGLVIGLAALTKEGTLGLIPMAVGTAVVAAWQEAQGSRGAGVQGRKEASVEERSPLLPRSPAPLHSSSPLLPCPPAPLRSFVISLVLIALPALAIAGWWYWRNVALYGDWLGWSAFIAVLGERGHPASLAQLWGERRGFLMSFWGLFGGVNVPMWPWVYTVLNGLLALSVVGFIVYLLRLLGEEWRRWRESAQFWFTRLLRSVERHFGLIVCLLFSAAVVYGLVQWATTTWSSQGRLVFTAISPLCVLMAIGIAEIGRWGDWGIAKITPSPNRPISSSSRLDAWLMTAVALFLFAVAAAAPWLWIRPAYQPPAYPGPLVEQTAVDFGDEMRLVGYEVAQDTLRPGKTVRVRLEWEVLREMERDWSVFVHLNDPVLGQPIAQRDMYPGAGLRATSSLAAGERLVDEVVLTVPPTAVAPAELEVVVGLYDFGTGERLPTADRRPPTAAGETPAIQRDAVKLAMLPLAAAEGTVPNPTSVFFEHGLELVGFAVEPRRAAAGATIELTTYWRPSEPLPDDFTFFAQIVGADTTRYAAADVAPPLPTSSWAVGEVAELRLPLPLDPATPPDVYPLIIGLYTRAADGSFDRRQLVTPDGRLTDDFLPLTSVRVTE